MKKIILIIGIFLLSSCVNNKITVNVGGKVIDQSTGQPLSGFRVALLQTHFSGFMTLPEAVEVASAVTNKDGVFWISGYVDKNFLVELDMDICWLPYRKAYKANKNSENNYDLIIYTEKISECN